MIQKHIQRLVIVFIIALPIINGIWPETVSADADLSATEAASRLQAVYDKTTCIATDFRQVTVMNINRRKRQGAGTLIFMKPGHMRWDYSTPDRQVLISDGKTISMYFENLRQMIVTSAREYLQSDVTYSFFAGTGKILQNFTVLPADSEVIEEKSTAPDAYVIKLIPKISHPQIDHLYVWISKDNFLIARLRIVDHFDTVTDLFFENTGTSCVVDRNGKGKQSINVGMFDFTPPGGTEIIKQ